MGTHMGNWFKRHTHEGERRGYARKFVVIDEDPGLQQVCRGHFHIHRPPLFVEELPTEVSV
jgi:hypothetical protein